MKRFFSILLAICMIMTGVGILPAVAAEELPPGRTLDENWKLIETESRTFDAESDSVITTVENVQNTYEGGVLTVFATGDVKQYAQIMRLPFSQPLTNGSGKYYMELTVKQNLNHAAANDGVRSMVGTGTDKGAVMLSHGKENISGKYNNGAWLPAFSSPDGIWKNIGIEVDMTGEEGTLQIYMDGTAQLSEVSPFNTIGNEPDRWTFWLQSAGGMKAGDSISFADFKMWKYEEVSTPEEPVSGRELDENWQELNEEHKTFDDVSSGISLPVIDGLDAGYQDGSLVMKASNAVEKYKSFDIPFTKAYTEGVYYLELLMKQNILEGDEFRSYFYGSGTTNSALMLTHGNDIINGKYNKNQTWLADTDKDIPTSDDSWIRLGVEIDTETKQLKIFVNGQEWMDEAVPALAESFQMDRIRFSAQSVKAGDSLTFDDFKMWKYEEVSTPEEPVSGRELDENWQELTQEHKTFDDADSGLAAATDASLEVSYSDSTETLKVLTDGASKYLSLNLTNAQQYTSGKYYMELKFKQKLSGNDVLRSYFGNKSGSEAVMFAHSAERLGPQYNNGGTWGENLTVIPDEWVYLGVEYDLDTDKVSIYHNGEMSEVGLTPNKGMTLSGLQFVTRSGIKAGDSLTFDDFKMWKYNEASEPTDAEKLAADKAALTWEVIKGSNGAQDSVTADLNLPDTIGANGTSAAWTSSEPETIRVEGTSGKVTRPADADKPVTLTAELSNNSAEDTVTFTVTVKKTETLPEEPPLLQGENLARGKSVSGSTEPYSTSAYGYDKMVDGDIATRLALKDNVSLANEWIQVDLGGEMTFNQIRMTEFAARLARWKYQYSTDGQVWTDIGGELTQADVSGTNIHAVYDFDAVTARYVRILILENRDSKGVSIFEMEIYNVHAPETPEEKLQYALDCLTEELILNGQRANAVTDPLNLPKEVPAVNAAVEWTAVPSFAVNTDTGEVYPRAFDLSVTLTASVQAEGATGEKAFTFTISKLGGTDDDNDKVPPERAGWVQVDKVVFDQAGETAGDFTSAASGNEIVKSFDQEGYLTFDVTQTMTREGYFSDYLQIPFPQSYTEGKHYAQTTFKADLTVNGNSNDIIRMWIGAAMNTSDYAVEPVIGDNISVGKATLGSQTDAWISGPQNVDYSADEWHTLGLEFDCDTQTVRYYLDGTEIFTERRAADEGQPLLFARDKAMSVWAWAFYRNTYEGHKITFKEFEFWSQDDSDFRSAVESLTYDALTDEKADSITGDLTLPTSFPPDITVAWSSSDSSVIDSTGKVTQNPFCDRTVTLTAVVEQASAGYGQVINFTFTVARQDAEKYVFVENDKFENGDILNGAEITGGSAEVTGGALVLTPQEETAVFRRYFGADGLRLEGTSVQFDLLPVPGNQAMENGFVLLAADGTSVLESRLTGGEYTVSGGGKTLSFPYSADKILSVIMNTEQKTAAIYLDGTKQGEVGMETGHISSFELNAAGSGSLRIEELALSIKSDNPDKVRTEIDVQALTEESITEESPENITKDLQLNMLVSGLTGCTITWSSSAPQIIAADGKVTRPERDTQVMVTAVVTSGSERGEKQFTFLVKGTTEENLAYGATAAASSEQAGYEAANLTDDSSATGWRAAADDSAPQLTITLGEIQKISNILLREDGNVIQAYTISVSENGNNWTQVFAGTTIGAERKITFDSVEARYVRLAVTQKAEGAAGLKVIEVRYIMSPQERVDADYEALKLEKKEGSDNYLLPVSGAMGSTIFWESSHPEIIDPQTGVVDTPSSTVTVTLTATVSYPGAADREKRFTVPFTRGSGSGSSGNGSSRPGGGVSMGGSSFSSSGGSGQTNNSSGAGNQQPEQTAGFTDVTEDRWSYPYIIKAQEAGIISGDGSGSFRPMDNVTREEFVKMIVLALELEAENAGNSFADVASDAWYAPYIDTAYSLGIVEGVTDTTFGVGAYISRQDMAVIIDRALTQNGTELADGSLSAFADADEIADYAKQSVARLNAAEILEGNEGSFAPNNNLTREEAAKVIALIMK